MDIRDLQEKISQLAASTINDFANQVQTLLNDFNSTQNAIPSNETEIEASTEEFLSGESGRNLTETNEHSTGFHGTTTLIILFVLLGIVLAAAVGTRIWNRWRKAKSKEEDRRQVYLYSWY
ncbi:Oidioi.mRNA.OKI2018_I69.XSR.g16360.t1.cds [Oikopleura dioica]|uniref:Oidioi.mRNA.OKI2018_I69.XSR.g16360.t1.cds n=1 Tax=Oikopleura dioica TaxID=34765 RepID=A0ABN7SGD1_OIKDI|nr:Oidioi.mRNA.OKI2018_I69.XSR.g16360.t1.cds [Oikopleura dioica]